MKNLIRIIAFVLFVGVNSAFAANSSTEAPTGKAIACKIDFTEGAPAGIRIVDDVWQSGKLLVPAGTQFVAAKSQAIPAIKLWQVLVLLFAAFAVQVVANVVGGLGQNRWAIVRDRCLFQFVALLGAALLFQAWLNVGPPSFFR